MGITNTSIKDKFRMQPCIDSNCAATNDDVRQNYLTNSLKKEMDMLFSEYIWSQIFIHLKCNEETKSLFATP